MDADCTKLSAAELMTWAVRNLWSEDEGGYAVRHGRRFVSDFRPPLVADIPDELQPNFFEKAYPCLFPYGRGGLEAARHTAVDFSDHICWTLQYHDRHFRRHETYPFVCLGIAQRRQALMSARLQMRRPNFEKEGRLIASVTVQKLQQACDEEAHGRPVSDPAVRLLRNLTYGAASRVQGSNAARLQLRSQIWSTCIMKNPPTLWITINPSDLHDPVAQVFAGEKIDLDHFMRTVGPDATVRAHNIASDPYAAASFFHFLIGVILETLFGITVTDFRVFNRPAVFGRVSAYYGAVESQGRGSLHLHMLLWLEDCPTGDEMHELLKTESFRHKVCAFIQANLRAYLPGLDSESSVQALNVEKDVAYSRPPNPSESHYEERLSDFELRVARSEQIHSCRIRQCLVLDKYGQYRCKRRAPFELSNEDVIDEVGEWRQKRLYEYVNGWIPALLINVRCNNDGKLLTHGQETKNITMYIGGYLAKPQGKNFNMSAVMAKGYAYHLNHPRDTEHGELDQIRDAQRLLLFRLVNSVNREQELAACMVMSYLMKWGDCFRSHHYSPIYFASFERALLGQYQSLKRCLFFVAFVFLNLTFECYALGALVLVRQHQ
jgi:hypothetical protein